MTDNIRYLLEEIDDYLDNFADADCVGDPAYYVPNSAMRLQTRVRDFLANARLA